VSDITDFLLLGIGGDITHVVLDGLSPSSSTPVTPAGGGPYRWIQLGSITTTDIPTMLLLGLSPSDEPPVGPVSQTLAPYVFPQFFDDNGDPLAGGLIYTYEAGTTTPAVTYSDAIATPNTNPVVLSAAGRTVIYLDPLSYKWILKDANGTTIATQDNIASIGLVTSGVYDVFSFGGDSNVPVTATSYPSGTTFTECHSGTAWLEIDSADLSGTYALSGMLLSVSGITVTAALVNLTDGAPETPLVTLASTSSTGELVISGNITFAATGTAKHYAIKCKVSAGSGFVWALHLIKTS
jgi:hypothetical protein